eukprot:244838-Prorocentrum_minimum.AAC.1
MCRSDGEQVAGLGRRLSDRSMCCGVNYLKPWSQQSTVDKNVDFESTSSVQRPLRDDGYLFRSTTSCDNSQNVDFESTSSPRVFFIQRVKSTVDFPRGRRKVDGP